MKSLDKASQPGKRLNLSVAVVFRCVVQPHKTPQKEEKREEKAFVSSKHSNTALSLTKSSLKPSTFYIRLPHHPNISVNHPPQLPPPTDCKNINDVLCISKHSSPSLTSVPPLVPFKPLNIAISLYEGATM
jgi:hypothetical protein